MIIGSLFQLATDDNAIPLAAWRQALLSEFIVHPTQTQASTVESALP